MNPRAVDFVYYTVSDLDRSIAFYRDTLGIELEGADEDIGWAEFALPPTTLALDRPSDEDRVQPGGGGVGLAISVDDVAAAVDELREQGVTVLLDTIDCGPCHMATVSDPDDNPIMLHHRHDGSSGRKNPFP